ncbi:PBP1 [Malassezia furfur]|nr:PBP1 [Malassezia furfur]
MRERVVALLAMLVGQMVVVTLASGERTAEDLDALQQHVTKAKPASGFRTDTEISQASRTDGRTLQRWDDAGEALEPSGLEGDGARPSAQGWDQFAANEARFGVKSDYEETMYTTKLDRSAKDFKQREREADRIAREILEQGADNVHVAEERNQVEAHDRNEEDKYGAVVRGANAYVPPAARTGSEEAPHPPRPPSAAPAPPAAPSASARATPVLAPPEAPASGQGSKALTADFRQFVSAERERLVVRKAELAQKEKQNRLTDLKAWAQSFRLTTPVPDDMPDLKRPAKKDDAKNAKPAAKPASKMSATARAFNPAAAAFTPGARAAPAPAAAPSAPPAARAGDARGGAAPAPGAPPMCPVRCRRRACAHAYADARHAGSGSSSRVMDDFRPPKNKKLPEAPTVTAWWPYNGRPFRQQVAMSAMPGPGGMPVGMPPMMPPMVGMYPNGKSPRPMQQEPRTPLGMPPQPGTPGDQPGYAFMYAPYGQYRFPGQPYLPPEAMQHAGVYDPAVPGQVPYGVPNAYMARPAPGTSPHAGKRHVQGSEPKASPAQGGPARDASAGGGPAAAGRAESGAGS